MRRSRFSWWVVFSLFGCFLTGAVWVSAQVPTSPIQSSPEPASADRSADEESGSAASLAPITPAEIQQRIAALETSSLKDADKQKAAEFYRKALAALSTHDQQLAEYNKYQLLFKKYETDRDYFAEQLATLPEQVPSINEDGTLAELEAELAEREKQLQLLRDLLAESNSQPKRRSDWLANHPKYLADIQQGLKLIDEQLAQYTVGETANEVSAAELLYLQLQKQALTAAKDALDKKREYYSTTGDLVQSRRDCRAKQVAQDEKYLDTLREEVNQRRLAEANQQASAAASAAAIQRPEAIAKLAEANAKLAKEQADIVSSQAQLDQELADAQHQLDQVRTAKKLSEERVQAAGRTEGNGQLLRQQQELLPDIRRVVRQRNQRSADQANATYSKYKLIDERNAVTDVDPETRVAAILAQVPDNLRAESEKEVRNLLESERKILEDAISTYENYLESLVKLSAVEEQLITTTQEYRDFIAENVLWIRSCSWPQMADVEPALGALAWSLNPAHWQETAASFWMRTRSAPAAPLLFGLLFVVALLLQSRLKHRLREIGQQAVKKTCTDFGPSVSALWISLLIALPWPLLLLFVGWWIDNPLSDSEFVRALAVSFKFAALCLFLLGLVRQFCRPGGLADAHFTWPQSCLVQVRQHIRWLMLVILPLVIWLTGLESQNVEALWSSSLGRVCFVAVMLLLAFACYRVLLSKESPFRQLLVHKPDRTHNPLWGAWAPLVTLLPVVLAILALVGYYYTALQLALRLVESAALVLTLLVAGGLAKRWILINRRRLAREQARQKRAAAMVAAEAAVSAGEEAPPLPPETFEDTVDLAALGEQTSRLLVTILLLAGLVWAWFIWREMLPALAYVGQSQVFPNSNLDNPLTWGQLLRFVMVVLVTSVATRNVPALLEFAILQHLPMDSGSRYAVTSICRYVIFAIGIVTGYSTLGFDSTSVQWLVAAMGVGLGFGLQEIFANFVSGIILLFERPIRVGDIVTLGDKTGQVARIRMRATTIVDWDRKEYIVPNKDLVTERLLNWTLSDQTNRIVVNVGVAYGSDTNLACRLLREAAWENPVVLRDPEPVAVFEGFGDSTLNLSLRVFLPSLEKRLLTIHDLHTAINQKFQAAGLEIAFRQTDIHIRSLPAEWLGGGQGKATDADRQTPMSKDQ